jgi:hypothetical protein
MEDKRKIQFNPLFFQASLAAGGVALMPFNFLQFGISHGSGLIVLSDIAWSQLTIPQVLLYGLLIAVMFIAITVHIILTAIFVKQLIGWIHEKKSMNELLEDPYKNATIFPIIGSLSMSVNVFWGPAGFFVPAISGGLQSLMLPSLIFFAGLWVTAIILQIKVIKSWMPAVIDFKKYNFVWLLDVFAFGLLNLTGSGIAATSNNETISTIAATATVLTIVFGFGLLIFKLFRLIITQVRARKLPDFPILPAFFIVIPITCLYGLSGYRLVSYYSGIFNVNIQGLQPILINLGYLISVFWLISTVYLIRSYLVNHFIKTDYSATQWSMVCALVGSQVLGVYVQGLYMQSNVLKVFNYVSIVIALMIYAIIIIKFMRSLGVLLKQNSKAF